jgi:hypothetical protein
LDEARARGIRCTFKVAPAARNKKKSKESTIGPKKCKIPYSMNPALPATRKCILKNSCHDQSEGLKNTWQIPRQIKTGSFSKADGSLLAKLSGAKFQ